MLVEEEDFLRSGFENYPKAFVAVSRFQDQMRHRFAEALRRRKASRAEFSYETGTRDEFYVGVVQRIRVAGDELKAAAGIAWDDDQVPYFYVYCADGPGWARSPEGPRFKRTQGYSYFVAPAKDTEPIDEQIEMMLTDWEKALDQARLAAR